MGDPIEARSARGATYANECGSTGLGRSIGGYIEDFYDIQRRRSFLDYLGPDPRRRRCEPAYASPPGGGVLQAIGIAIVAFGSSLFVSGPSRPKDMTATPAEKNAATTPAAEGGRLTPRGFDLY